jgi:hypothetical protein
MAGSRATASRDTPNRKKALQDATWDALTGRKPAEVEVPVLLDPDLAAKVDEARQHYDAADTMFTVAGRQPGGAPADLRQKKAAAKEALDAIEAEAAEATRIVRLRELPRLEYQTLQDAWPPRDDSEEHARRDAFLGQNIDEFPARLIAKCLVAPPPDPDADKTVEMVKHLLDTWPSSEALNLVNQAVFLNTRRRVAELGKG